MSITQFVDLIPMACYESSQGIVTTATLEVFEDAGVSIPLINQGRGQHVLVGRNRDLTLTLDIRDIPLAGTLDVTIETAATPGADAWRKLGTFSTQNATGQTVLTFTGADAFVRAYYKLSNGSAFSFAIYGEAVFTLAGSSAQVASGASAAVDLAQYRSSRLTLDVTAVSGTLTVSVETCATPGAPAAAWLTVVTLPAVTALASVDFVAPNLARFARLRWVLSGGGSATFGVLGTAEFTLATPSDRARLGMGDGAFPSMTVVDQDSWLCAATADILGFWEGRYTRPIKQWADDARKACIAIADWYAIAGRGTEPGKAIDPKLSTYYERYMYAMGSVDAKGWVRLVAERKAHPMGLVDSATQDVRGNVSRVAIVSEPLRGWGRRQVLT